MKEILKINGVPILNFIDLQREFSPLALYDNLSLFREFSKVHCLNLPILAKKDDSEACPTEYFDKALWQSVLENEEWKKAADEGNVYNGLKEIIAARFIKKHIDDLIVPTIKQAEVGCRNESKQNGNRAAVEKNEFIESVRKWIESNRNNNQDIINDKKIQGEAKAYLRRQISIWIDYIIDESAEKEAPKKHAYFVESELYVKIKALEEEYRYVGSKLKKEIQFIIQKLGDDKESAKKTLLLTAVCELAEVNALTANWNTGFSDVKKEDKTPKIIEPTDFTYENSVTLLAGNQPYRFWCYEGDTLPKGECIRTVRLEGRRAGDFKKVNIEIISKSTNKRVQKIVLNASDSVYVNAIGNRVIKALPEYAVSKNNCIIKRGDKLWVYPKGRAAWTTEIKNISSVATGTVDEGFLIVADGKILIQYCDSIESSYTAKLMINAIITPVVEVRKANVGFDILLNDGTIINSHSDVERSEVKLSGVEKDTIGTQSEILRIAESYGEDVKYAISKIQNKFQI